MLVPLPPQLVDLWSNGANQGFLVPPLVRFVSEDSGYLSYTNGGPRMFINLEDHLSHTTKKPNVQFEVCRLLLCEEQQASAVGCHACMLLEPMLGWHAQRVMRYLVQNCNARMHWGKAGWPWLEPCFDGAAHYANWCDFGCAVQVRNRCSLYFQAV